MDRVAAVPGVSSVAMSSDAPLTGASSAVFYAAEGDSTSGANRAPRAYIHRVSPGFFSTLDIPFRDGRTFTDGELSPSSSAVIVSEAVAKRFWPGQSALGRRIKIGNAASQNPWLAIVGVVPELKYRALPNNPTADPDLYMPILDRAQQSLVIRTAQAPSAVSPGVRAALRETSRAIVPFAESPLDQLVQAQTATSRFTTWVLGFFAAAALLLAMIGLYGVVSYLVDQREMDFGIRLALGAEPGAMLRMIVREGVGLTLVGCAIGVVGAFAAGRSLSSFLFSVEPWDPATLGGVIGVVVLVAIGACVVPGRRAAAEDPASALRVE
jgi:predicted permease